MTDHDLDLPPDSMEKKYIARFDKLEPTKRALDAKNGVPPGAYEMIASRDIYRVMGAEGSARAAAVAPLSSRHGLEVVIVECPPGTGAGLHRHQRTSESFMPLDGKYEIYWGEQGQHSTVLKPYDMFDAPPGLFRGFRNVDDHPARMLVFIQGKTGDAFNDLLVSSKVGRAVEEKYGPEVLEKLKGIGMTFEHQLEAGA
ncbi:MAG: cupin domain-containing protein [Lautropia sp.]